MSGVDLTSSIIFFAAAFLATLFGVTLFTRWSLHRGMVDVPNERSSHSTPTPRGGGFVIVAVCLAGYLVGGLVLGLPISWGYFAGALLVAGISWFDDLYSVPFWGRLIVHLCAAAILILDVGVWSELSIPLIAHAIPLGNIFGIILTVGWVVSLLNAFNFMDGIDGIAATEALICSAAWAVLAWLLNMPAALFFSGIVASSSAGFLVHNWQPAKVFMGDVGSAFFGFTLAALPLLARYETGTEHPVLPVIAVLFVWFFVFDTLFTFTRRVLSKKRVWEAHREHVYQKLVVEGRDHSTVTLIYGSAAALLSSIVIVAVIFSGIYVWLAFFTFVVLTILITYLGIRNKS